MRILIDTIISVLYAASCDMHMQFTTRKNCNEIINFRIVATWISSHVYNYTRHRAKHEPLDWFLMKEYVVLEATYAEREVIIHKYPSNLEVLQCSL